MLKPLTFNEWLDKYADDLVELPEDEDLEEVYQQYVASWEEQYVDMHIDNYMDSY